jgi:arsenite methyltransferase
MNVDKKRKLREGVRKAYSAAAENPLDEHPFPVGRHFAESLGYPPDLLAASPSLAVDAFSGVSNVAVFAEFQVGITVLDLGCGSGLDSIIAAKRVGTNGKVIGADFSAAMLFRARQAAMEIGIDNIGFCQADAEKLPIDDGSLDLILVNGIFNLSLDREAILRELARVVRHRGVVYAAELILHEPLPQEIRASETDWFA